MWCGWIAHTRCCCCAGCSDALRPLSAAVHMSSSTKVSKQIDHCTTAQHAASAGGHSLTCCYARMLLLPAVTGWLVCPRVFRCSVRDASTGCRRQRRAATGCAYLVATLPPLLLRPPLLLPRPLRLLRCSLRTQAATLLCRSSNARPSSYSRSKACLEER